VSRFAESGSLLLRLAMSHLGQFTKLAIPPVGGYLIIAELAAAPPGTKALQTLTAAAECCSQAEIRESAATGFPRVQLVAILR
jgi:hypothetical protein